MGGREISIGGRDLIALARDAIAKGATLRVRARGHSMSPAIRDGETVEIAPFDRGPEPGDAALVDGPRGARIHRVISRDRGPGGETYLVCGDADPGPPERVAPGDVVGLVRERGRGLDGLLARLLRRLRRA